MERAAAASLQSSGLTFPHPNHGAALVSGSGALIATGCYRAQGAPSVEEQLLSAAGGAAAGATMYLNLETGDCHGDTRALEALLRSGVARVVVGMRHPLSHMRGAALSHLQASGVDVQLLEAHADAGTAGTPAAAALRACLDANEVRRPWTQLTPPRCATHVRHT